MGTLIGRPQMRPTVVAAVVVGFRLLNGQMIASAFNPDEYWQNGEVAHRLVFGYGHLTWEWAAGLRGSVHPLATALVYSVLKTLRLDSHSAVAAAPRMLQSVLAAGADMVVLRLTDKVFGRSAAGWALVCQMASWFNFFCLVRPFSNSMEAVLLLAAVYLWPCSALLPAPAHRRAAGTVASAHPAHQDAAAQCLFRHPESFEAAVFVSGLVVVIRPASAPAFVPLAVAALLVPDTLTQDEPGADVQKLPDGCRSRASDSRPVLRRIGGRLLATAGAASFWVAASVALDWWVYRRALFVPWEFVKFNLLEGGSATYGAHPSHWYFSQGLPAVLATLTPAVLHGMLLAARRSFQLLWLALLALWMTAAYSLAAHKEFRFALPALQLLMPYCGLAISSWLRPCFVPPANTPAAERAAPCDGAKRDGNAGVGVRGSSGQAEAPRASGRRWCTLAGVAVMLLTQAAMAWYFSRYHQAGTVAVVRALASEAAAVREPSEMWVLFLMQCHATPFFSHVHAPIRLTFLDCSPPGWQDSVALLNKGSGTTMLFTRGNHQKPRCSASSEFSGSESSTGDCDDASNSQQWASEEALVLENPLYYLCQAFGCPGGDGERATADDAPPPSHLVMYDLMAPRIEPFLRFHGYDLVSRHHHAHLPVDHGNVREVFLFRRPAPSEGRSEEEAMADGLLSM